MRKRDFRDSGISSVVENGVELIHLLLSLLYSMDACKENAVVSGCLTHLKGGTCSLRCLLPHQVGQCRGAAGTAVRWVMALGLLGAPLGPAEQKRTSRNGALAGGGTGLCSP